MPDLIRHPENGEKSLEPLDSGLKHAGMTSGRGYHIY